MRPFVLGVVVTLALPAAAAAKGHPHPIAPPGNSGVLQYVETIPTAHGGRPTGSVAHGGGGPNPGGGLSGGGGGTGGGSTISPATQRALVVHGVAGRATAAFVAATAPRNIQDHGRSDQTNGAGDGGGTAGRASQASGSSPAHSILDVVAGSSASGGLGLLLPIILVGCLLALSSLAFVRRRRSTT